MDTAEAPLILLCMPLPLQPGFAIDFSRQPTHVATIVISRSELRDRDWFNARHMMCKNKQCCPVSSEQHHVPGEHVIHVSG